MQFYYSLLFRRKFSYTKRKPVLSLTAESQQFPLTNSSPNITHGPVRTLTPTTSSSQPKSAGTAIGWCEFGRQLEPPCSSDLFSHEWECFPHTWNIPSWTSNEPVKPPSLANATTSPPSRPFSTQIWTDATNTAATGVHVSLPISKQ